MGVAGERLRKSADLRPAQRLLRQQRRVGMGFIQPFDDRKRLGENGAVVALQGGNKSLAG